MTNIEIISKIKDLNGFVNKYKKLLSIKEDIELRSSTQPGDTSIVCDCNNKKWILIYFPDDPIFLLIHELGHLHLAMITKCVYFAKQPNSNINRGIFQFVNTIVDAIVNYKISRFDKIYPFFINYIETVFNATKGGINIVNMPFPLSHYIDYYLELKFYFKKSELESLKPKIERFLKDYENQLILNRILDGKKLSLIKDSLEKLSEYLDSAESSTFIYCITKILKIIKMWSNGLINKNIKNIFQK